MPLVDILSADRFGTYLGWAAGDVALAERLYTYNVRLSADFYGSLHMLEVALRNRADEALTRAFGPGWMQDPAVLVDPYQRRCLAEATASLQRDQKAVTHSQLVAELNFGFWGSLFGRSSTNLWGSLRGIFQAGGIQRSVIARKLRDQRRLRNRIAHYEPIIAQPVAALHQDILDLTEWLSIDAFDWIVANSLVNIPPTTLLVTDPASGAPIFDRALEPHLP